MARLEAVDAEQTVGNQRGSGRPTSRTPQIDRCWEHGEVPLKGSYVGIAYGTRGQRTSCVQRKRAIFLPVTVSVTTASHTCVALPRCTGVATQTMVPARAVPRKLLFNSMVVK